MSNFPEYYRGFEKMQEFMIADLKNATIKGHANFLVTMGLFNYIEALGGFYFPCDINDKEKKRFDFVFKELLPNEYKLVFEDIRSRIATTYNILRCGMTHGYLPRTFINENQNINVEYIIFGADNQLKFDQCIKDKSCGIELTNQKTNKYLITIYNPRMIYDLEIALTTLKEKINNDDAYKAKFIMRASDINLDRLV